MTEMARPPPPIMSNSNLSGASSSSSSSSLSESTGPRQSLSTIPPIAPPPPPLPPKTKTKINSPVTEPDPAFLASVMKAIDGFAAQAARSLEEQVRAAESTWSSLALTYISRCPEGRFATWACQHIAPAKCETIMSLVYKRHFEHELPLHLKRHKNLPDRVAKSLGVSVWTLYLALGPPLLQSVDSMTRLNKATSSSSSNRDPSVGVVDDGSGPSSWRRFTMPELLRHLEEQRIARISKRRPGVKWRPNEYSPRDLTIALGLLCPRHRESGDPDPVKFPNGVQDGGEAVEGPLRAANDDGTEAPQPATAQLETEDRGPADNHAPSVGGHANGSSNATSSEHAVAVQMVSEQDPAPVAAPIHTTHSRSGTPDVKSTSCERFANTRTAGIAVEGSPKTPDRLFENNGELESSDFDGEKFPGPEAGRHCVLVDVDHCESLLIQSSPSPYASSSPGAETNFSVPFGKGKEKEGVLHTDSGGFGMPDDESLNDEDYCSIRDDESISPPALSSASDTVWRDRGSRKRSHSALEDTDDDNTAKSTALPRPCKKTAICPDPGFPPLPSPNSLQIKEECTPIAVAVSDDSNDKPKKVSLSDGGNSSRGGFEGSGGLVERSGIAPPDSIQVSGTASPIKQSTFTARLPSTTEGWGRVDMLCHDLRSLQPKQWVNDSVLTALLLLLERRKDQQEHQHTSGATGSRIGLIDPLTFARFVESRSPRKAPLPPRFFQRLIADLHTRKKVIIVANCAGGTHWCLVLFDLLTSTLSLADSLPGPSMSQDSLAKKPLVKDAVALLVEIFGAQPHLHYKAVCPSIQQNPYDCGVLVYHSARHVMMTSDLPENQYDILGEGYTQSLRVEMAGLLMTRNPEAVPLGLAARLVSPPQTQGEGHEQAILGLLDSQQAVELRKESDIARFLLSLSYHQTRFNVLAGRLSHLYRALDEALASLADTAENLQHMRRSLGPTATALEILHRQWRDMDSEAAVPRRELRCAAMATSRALLAMMLASRSGTTPLVDAWRRAMCILVGCAATVRSMGKVKAVLDQLEEKRDQIFQVLQA